MDIQALRGGRSKRRDLKLLLGSSIRKRIRRCLDSFRLERKKRRNLF